MTDSRLLLGVCGLYCGACYHYRASFPEGRHLLEEARLQGRELTGFTCAGCRSDTLYIHPGCAQCRIRACADDKGILHRTLFGVPCDRLRASRMTANYHLDSSWSN